MAFIYLNSRVNNLTLLWPMVAIFVSFFLLMSNSNQLLI